MVFLHGGGVCLAEAAFVVPAIPFAISAFYAARYYLKGRHLERVNES